jgi:SAM-dependent methyltransferase
MTFDTSHPFWQSAMRGAGTLPPLGGAVDLKPAPVVDLAHPGSEFYDASYFGADPQRPAKANYHGYRPSSIPHWSAPLAGWLAVNLEGPFLDVGAAYGHLCRDLNAIGAAADAVEWSGYAYANRVTQHLRRGDARKLPFADEEYGTVTSLDLLEHFTPPETELVLQEMKRVSRRGAAMVHVIGAHNPQEDLSRHLEDPSHANHEPLGWYLDRFAELGFFVHERLTQSVRALPAIVNTDWVGRTVVLVEKRTW